MTEIIKVIYRYRTGECGDGCCSWDESVCDVYRANEKYPVELEEFGCMFDKDDLVEKLNYLLPHDIISPDCDFTECQYY